MDLNNDSKPDMISGCYMGEVYYWEGREGNKFDGYAILKHENGKDINIGKGCTVTAVDIDNDGDFDLLLNSLYDGVFVVVNKGTKEQPVFENEVTVLSQIGADKIDYSSFAQLFDWDNDGDLDLIYATIDGDVLFCKGVDSKFSKPEYLIRFNENHNHAGLKNGEVPSFSGRNPRFTIFDYNNDGKMDIVMGTDVYITYTRTLSEDDLTKKAELQKNRTLISEEWGKQQDKIMKRYNLEHFNMRNIPYDKMSKKIADKFRLINGELSKNYSELSKFNTTYNRNSGMLWVYFKK